MAAPAVQAHTAAMKAKLETNADALPVGVGAAPLGVAAPYYVLHLLPSGEHDGPLDDPDADWQLEYQVVSVGVGEEQAEGYADLARVTLQGTPLVVSGRDIWRVEATSLGGVARDDGFQPPLFFVPEVYQVGTTPA